MFLTSTACGGNETTESKNTENEPAETATPETPDLTLPAEAVFAAQVAQSLLGEPLTDNDQNCIFTAATDNDEFAESIAAVLDPNAALTPTYFKSLITSVRDCVGQQRMSNAIALGLSINEENPELSECLNETFFKIFLVICLVPVAILVGKAFLLLSPILFWVLGYMAFKKGNQNETIMWLIFAVLGLILAFVI